MAIIFLLLILSSCTSLVLSTDQNDDTVLLKIKEQVGNPGSLNEWVDGFDFCNNQPAQYVPIHITCTSTGRVNTISIGNFILGNPNSPLSAPFPQAICDLTELETLYIFKVDLYGPITCINKLINLREVYIFSTSLGGPIPEFPNQNNLTTIDLEMNFFSGSIPPSLSKLPNLRNLILHQNALSGTIPPGLVHGPSASLDLSDNSLTGEIPRCYELVNFFTIRLRNNRLSGDASFLFGKVTQHIDLSYNQLEFDLSNVEIPENLAGLVLNNNGIYGKVPNSIANASKLSWLDLSSNTLCGEIPQGGFMWRYNSYVYDNNTCLCGSPLPPCSNSAPTPAPIFAPPFDSTP